MITVHRVTQGTDEWDKLREGLYTGSNADKLLSHSSSIKVVNGVVSSYASAEISSFGGNFHTNRGHILEEEALEVYEQITGHRVARPGFITNSKWPGCGYSPDGDDLDLDIPLEVKAFEEPKHIKMFKGKIPMKVLAQMHFGQLIWEKKGARLIIYNPNFAKKQIRVNDELVINPNYDPSKAFKIIEVKYNRNIQNNFKRILRKESHVQLAKKA